MKERRSQSSTKRIDWVPLSVIACFLCVFILFPEIAGASKSSAPVKKDSQEQEKEQAESHHGKWRDTGSDDEHYKKWRNDDSDNEHHGRRHGNGDRRHGRGGNWGDNDESSDGRRKKLHSLDDDYTMEQIWKLPGLNDKQRNKLIAIEKKFYTEVRPMRRQLKGIREELDGTNVRFGSNAGGEIGGAVMSGFAKFGTDKQRDPTKRLEKGETSSLSSGSKKARASEKAKAAETKQWYHADQIEMDDGKEPTYKSARNSALQNRAKVLKRKMKATKEKAWIDIRAVLTTKQKAVLAQQ